MAHQANVPATELHWRPSVAKELAADCERTRGMNGDRACFGKLTSASGPVVGRQLQTARGTSAPHTSGVVS